MMTLPPRLTRMSLLLTLLLLAPRVGLAAEEAPQLPADAPAGQPARSTDEPLPGTGERPNLRLMDPPAPALDRPAQPLRILAEVGASVLTGAGGLVLGYFGTLALGISGLGSSYGLFAPILMGIGTGVAVGTYWGGQVTGGDADLFSTILGMLAGGAAGVLLSIPMENPAMSILFCPPLMMLGSIIGYESTERGALVTRVQPMLSVSSRGAAFGLAGTF